MTAPSTLASEAVPQRLTAQEREPSKRSIPAPGTVTEQPRAQPVSRRLLLSLYAIVPIAILTPIIDQLFGGRLLHDLPRHPDQLWVWALLFNVPHIVASVFLLADAEYIKFYRRSIAIALLAVALFWVACFFVPSNIGIWIALAVTQYHVLGQQVGITRMMGGGDPGPALQPYRWVAVVLTLTVYMTVDLHVAGRTITTTQLGTVLLVPLTLCAFSMWRRLRGGLARSYLAANHVMLLAAVPLASFGYGFFVVVMLRFVHDLSAFVFYVAHDTSRNRDKPRGLLYRVFGFLHLPAWVMLPVASIGSGFVISTVDPTSILHPVALISLFHYIMEARTWHRGGLHRRSIAVT